MARWVRSGTESDGERVGRLMDALRGPRSQRQESRETRLVRRRRRQSQVRSHGAVELDFRKHSHRRNVMVEEHLSSVVPEQEPILLHSIPGHGPLELARLAELVLMDGVDAPVHQDSKIGDPLSKARKERIGAVDGVRDLGPVEDPRIMRPHAETKVGEVADAFAGVPKRRWDGNCSGGSRQRRTRLSAENAALQTSSANQTDAIRADGGL